MDIPEISAASLKKIIDYKQLFAGEDVQKALAAMSMPHDLYSVEKINRFLTELDVLGFNLIFDYQKWAQEQQEGFDKNPEFLNKADLTALRKLMTYYIRTERFLPGYLKDLFESGYITSFLTRLEELYQQM